MAHKVIDRCKETTSTTGTGTLTLTGAVANFVAMADATQGLTADGDTSWFCAENGAEWEVFLGTRLSSTTLARTTVISSSNAGATVSFTAAPTVFGTVPASKLSTVGPSVSAYRATSNQAITASTEIKVQFNAEEFDTGNCFDSTTNNRFQPNVAGYYQVSFAVNCGATSGITYMYGTLYKNGASIASGTYVPIPVTTDVISTGARLVYMNGTTDYLEVFAYSNGTSPYVRAGSKTTYFTASLAALPGAPMLAPIVAPGPSFRADRITTDQTVTASVWTKVSLNSETFDNGNCFDSTTNYRWTPNVEGYYQISVSVDHGAASGLTSAISAVRKNGVAALYGSCVFSAATSEIVTTGGGLIYMNGTTDYLELFSLHSGTTPVVKFSPATYMTGFLAALPQVPQPTSGPAFRAYLSANQTGMTSGAWAKAALNTTEFDVGGCFDAVTNNRFTPNVAGYYKFDWLLHGQGATLTTASAKLYKNGVNVTDSTYAANSSTNQRVVGSRLIYMNGTTDYVELWGLVSGTTLAFVSGSTETSLSGHWVRPG